MNTIQPFVLFLIGLGTYAAIMWLRCYISCATIDRRSKRYAQAEAEVEAGKIRDLIVATHNCFKGKYMPPALRELLTEARADYRSLSQRSHDVSSKEQLSALTKEVNEILESINRQTLIASTAADFEADKLALEQEEIGFTIAWSGSIRVHDSRIWADLSGFPTV